MPDAPDTPPDRDASRIPPHRYTPSLAGSIETRWQERWDQAGLHVQPNPGEPGFDPSKPKFYCLDMFPYPSGAGLHVGHPEGYTATDIVSRYKRMRGYNVLHPMGWDAFGLPAEQYAIQTGVHPAQTTRTAIDNFRRQLKRFGFCYDWTREVATCDPEYYRWTQWIFLRLYNSWFDPRADHGKGAARSIEELIHKLEHSILGVDESGEPVYLDERVTLGPLEGEPVGVRQIHELEPDELRLVIDGQRLAYIDEQTVNWCPKLGTVLANEEVIDGLSERGGHPVYRKPMRQWLFRITRYADRLLDGLDGLEWPESTKAQQAEWIGRSEGAEIDFEIECPSGPKGAQRDPDGPAMPSVLRVYTTRPDTVFGATFMVVAPEHPLVDAALAAPPPNADARALRDYVERARNRSDVERQEARDKSGVFTGVRAINPATGAPIPVWTADYVLMGYGLGAIMAVPAHDERDFQFAERYGLEIRDAVYSRPQAAMAYFASHARADERTPERWAGVLADLLAIVATESVDPDGFADALERVRARRASTSDQSGTSVSIDPAGAAASDPPGRAGDQGGVASIEWLDLLPDLGLDRFETLEAVFNGARFHRSRGDAQPEPGFAAHSSSARISIDGLRTQHAKQRVIEWLEAEGIGRRTVHYRLRDWLFSRQRYWGEPIPIVFDSQGRHHPVSPEHLPVTLPALDDFRPPESEDPQPLLGKAFDWVRTTAARAGVRGLNADEPVVRETNTMPGWAGSCWYHLRYVDPRCEHGPVGSGAESYWLDGGVDLYIGGAEHAVLHLLYARFWHAVLYDLGLVSSPEPYRRLFHQGLILSSAYQRADKTLVPIDEVDEPEPGVFVERATGQRVEAISAKMSKSLRNVVNPDDVIAEYGADTFRLYEMYMGPLEAAKPWNTRDIGGLHRFLARAWRLIVDEHSGRPFLGDEPDPEIDKRLHRTIQKVGADIERLSFNTAIASMIELVNAATATREKGGAGLTADQARLFTLVLSPFAPHIAEELWHRLGLEGFCGVQPWPEPDPAMLVDDEVEIPVQIRGKVRHRVLVPAGADPDHIERVVMDDPKVAELLEGKEVRKVVVVPGRMVNIVV